VHHKQAVDLQSRINDLIGIQALPAIWSGQQSYDIVGILLEAVVRILDLDFLRARAGFALRLGYRADATAAVPCSTDFR
jgi:hypothetical protein